MNAMTFEDLLSLESIARVVRGNIVSFECPFCVPFELATPPRLNAVALRNKDYFVCTRCKAEGNLNEFALRMQQPF